MPRSEELALRENRQASSNPWLGVVVGGKYRIEGVLGKGGMGTVYRATHELSLAPVALKILHPRLAAQSDARSRLLAEAQKAARLRGEHVARILDVGESPDGSIFVAMELVEGHTLAELLATHGALPPRHVRAWLVEMATALRVAHEAGVVHRDLSPSNVLVETAGGRGRLKIVDFGIAVQAGSADPVRELWIKPPYTAPEMLTGDPCDERVDLFALGVIAYEMLTGRVPFAGGSLEARIRSVLEDAPGEWATPGIPRRLRRLVHGLLAKDPAGRPPSATAVLETLAAMDAGPSPWLRAAALGVFALGTFLAGRDLFRAETPQLTAALGARIALADLAPGPATPAYVVPFEELERLPLELRHFGGAQLRIGLFDGPRRLSEATFSESFEDGRIVLDTERHRAWRSIVADLVERTEPTVLGFFALVRGEERSLAWSRLHVDAESPRFVSLDAEPRGVLRISSRIDVAAADDVGLDRVRFVLVEAGGLALAEFVQEANGARSFAVPLGEILAAKRVPPRREPVLEVQLIDRAGRSVARRLAFEESSFAIPSIEEVRSPRGDKELRVSDGHTELLLRLSSAGEGVTQGLTVRLLDGPNATPIELASEILEVLKGPELRVRLEAPPFPTRESETFTFAFELTDRVGNRSEKTERLRFRNLELRPRFELGEGDALARMHEGTLFTAGQRQEFRYRCNPAFVPQLRVAPTTPVQLVHQSPGELLLEVLPSSTVARHELVVEHVLADTIAPGEVPPRGTAPQRLGILILPHAPRLDLRDSWLDGELWLPAVLEGTALERHGDGFRLGQGLVPASPAETQLRGGLWRRHGEGLWESCSGPGLLPFAELRQVQLELVPGRNRFALELTDVLGRPLVARDENIEPRRDLDVAGRRLVPVLDFWHDPRPPRPAGEILVAWREPAFVRLEEDATFDPRASIVLLPPDLDASSQGYPGTQHRVDGRNEVRVRLPFAGIVRWCGWDALDAESFVDPRRPPEERTFVYRCPAGDFEVSLRFRPTRSLLRHVQLAELARTPPPPELDLRLVPFRGPEGDRTLQLGVPRDLRVGGTLQLREPFEVGEIGDYFLGDREVTRRSYARFVEELSASPPDPERVQRLGHVEDPLGERRFTREGLLPARTIYDTTDFDAWVQAGPERPVTGVNYFQALAFCRWLGERLFDDADSFRLPFAAELEWAALGELPPGARNGLRLRPEEADRLADRFAAARAALEQDGRMPAGRWPAAAAELERLGDHAPGLGGARVYGLDFGVREWCEDVPLFEQGNVRDLFRRLARSLTGHRAFAEDRRVHAGGSFDRAYLRSLRLGVVSGLAWAEPDQVAGDPVQWLRQPQLSAQSRVVGVKRSVQIHRDGSGLFADSISPMLQVLGFRVAGTRHFLDRVRRQVR